MIEIRVYENNNENNDEIKPIGFGVEVVDSTGRKIQTAIVLQPFSQPSTETFNLAWNKSNKIEIMVFILLASSNHMEDKNWKKVTRFGGVF